MNKSKCKRFGKMAATGLLFAAVVFAGVCFCGIRYLPAVRAAGAKTATSYGDSAVIDFNEMTWIGDVNDDKAVNVKDLVRIKQYLNATEGKGISERKSNLDFNETIDKDDLELLRQLLVGMDIFS